MKRRAGWYCVDYGQGWTCDHWDGVVWSAMDEMMMGRSTGMSPLRVGGRVMMPDEPWVTVPVDPTDDMIDAAMYRAGESEVPRGSESWRAMGQVIKFAHEAAPKTEES